ncbi:MAG: glycogen debranching protein [Lentisphaerae bacterium]|nr:glycogen debranching protein [Lentisphaerota bacterium]
MIQQPSPGSRLVRFCGDIQSFSLDVPASWQGEAWLRTNLGRSAAKRADVVRHSEAGTPLLATDWHDVRMAPASPGRFELEIPLLEVGEFEAKTFFARRNDAALEWTEGPNAWIKVEPAAYCSSNTVYSAFVRQFGPNKAGNAAPGVDEKSLRQLDSAGYTVIPRSGTFRDLVNELDLIIDRMGFRIIQLLPIHPTPTTYARMGRFGSPFAALDFMDVDPALADFDRVTTPLDQFRELVDAVHSHGAVLFIDMPINHTGWASWLQIHHPDWFARNGDRSFQSPGAWGVTWEDLSRLDYDNSELMVYMADVFLHWCRQGVDGFRCDAGYMVPPQVWSYITARVRGSFPDTVFLLEGLGGKQDTVEQLLSKCGLDWAYSELFQCYDRSSISPYLDLSNRTSNERGLLLHFAETHDNNRLAATSRLHSRMRTALSAMSSVSGGFGITAGVEWYADRKVDVHGASSLAWGREENMVEFLRRINAILDIHPCFGPGVIPVPVTTGPGNVLVLYRAADDDESRLLVCANLDCANPQSARWPESLPGSADRMTDLLSGKEAQVAREGRECRVELAPGQVLCLTAGPDDIGRLNEALSSGAPRWRRNTLRSARVTALRTLERLAPGVRPQPPDVEAFLAGPDAFCASANPDSFPHLTAWNAPEDLHRVVPVPYGHVILARCASRFDVDLTVEGVSVQRQRSLQSGDGRHFAILFPPQPPDARQVTATIALTTWNGHKAAHRSGAVLLLPEPGACSIRRSYPRSESMSPLLHAILTNGRGAMAQVRARWACLHSLYDAMLAANLHTHVPVDRHIMLTRCRGWLVHRQYSQELNEECQTGFSSEPGGPAYWDFMAPAGMGKLVSLRVAIELHRDRNAVTLTVSRRRQADAGPDELAPGDKATIILRPDIEDRVNHSTTKAFTGPEKAWRHAVSTAPRGFKFAPDPNRALTLASDRGTFVLEPEWQYAVRREFEAQRGLDPLSDLFSPGYIKFDLAAGETAVISASVSTPACPDAPDPATGLDLPLDTPLQPVPLLDTLKTAMSNFIVRRESSKTVIAGYPWFLDWGRDTLIALRGVIAAGMHPEASDILCEFARFERNGTLPNMLRGMDDSNRDTSDAPLWLAVACRDMAAAAGAGFLDSAAGDRTVRDAIESIAVNYCRGTPNGIRMDLETGLVFSPPHFTWMDTNYPAGTPRQGYPVEIQALWFATLRFLAAHGQDRERWAGLSKTVADSLSRFFWRKSDGFLADCLHAPPGTPPAAAVQDDAIRPNQLLAVTLGDMLPQEQRRSLVRSCECLLVPGAIRSLADRAVSTPLPVSRNGALLNDPRRPYWGSYAGDEDTRRKPAYHNGTAWTWPFPSYAEALVAAWGPSARESAASLLESSARVLHGACVGQVPEILDGNAPHTARGCMAQAWGVTELYRVLRKLTEHPA